VEVIYSEFGIVNAGAARTPSGGGSFKGAPERRGGPRDLHSSVEILPRPAS
jgi:hypothetical protein